MDMSKHEFSEWDSTKLPEGTHDYSFVENLNTYKSGNKCSNNNTITTQSECEENVVNTWNEYCISIRAQQRATLLQHSSLLTESECTSVLYKWGYCNNATFEAVGM